MEKAQKEAQVDAWLAPARPPLAPVQASVQSGQALPGPVTLWLNRLSRTSGGDAYPPDVTQRLLYLVTAVEKHDLTPELGVELVSVRALKDGGFSEKTSRQVFHHFDPDKAPRFYRPADIDICQTLVEDPSRLRHAHFHHRWACAGETAGRHSRHGPRPLAHAFRPGVANGRAQGRAYRLGHAGCAWRTSGF